MPSQTNLESLVESSDVFSDTDVALKLCSYNLHFNRGIADLDNLVEETNPDLLCIQECDTDKIPRTIGRLSLIAASEIGTQGLATYGHLDKLQLIDVDAPNIGLCVYERIFPEERNRLLITRFRHIGTGNLIAVGNFHATHLVSTNKHRKNQIYSSFEQLAKGDQVKARILIGDYNYPFFKEGLRRHAERKGIMLTIPDKHTYASPLLKGAFDFIATDGAVVNRFEIREFMTSDHAPVIVEFNSLDKLD